MDSLRLSSSEIRLRMARHYVEACEQASRLLRNGLDVSRIAMGVTNILNAQTAAEELSKSSSEACQLCWKFPLALGVVGVSLIGSKELIRWNTQGRIAAKSATPVESRMRLDLQLSANLGFLYSMVGDLQRSAEQYNVARYFATRLNDRSRVGEMAGHLGEVLCELGQYEPAGLLLKSSREYATKGTPRERAVAEFRLGRFYRLLKNPEIAAQCFRLANEIAQTGQLDDMRSRVMSEFASLLQEERDFSGAIRLYEESLKLADAHRDHNLEGRLTAAMADAYFGANDLVSARAFYGKAITIFGRTGDLVSDGRTRAAIGAVHARQGDFNQALGYFKGSYEIAKQCGDREGSQKAVCNITILLEQMGQKEEYTRLRSEAFEILKSASSPAALTG